MNLSERPSAHGPTAIALHWLVAHLFAVAFVLGQIMEEMSRGSGKLAVMGWHLLIGGVIFALLLPRLVARIRAGWPRYEGGAPWERSAAHWVHIGLYAMMAAIPLTGFIAATSGPATIPLPGGFELSPLLSSRMLHGAMEETHEFLVSALIAIVGLHIAGVLWHKYVRRDGAAGRMWPFRAG